MYSQQSDKVSKSFSGSFDVSSLPTGLYYIEVTAKDRDGSDKKEIKQVKKIVVL
jgi:hypothetical protein